MMLVEGVAFMEHLKQTFLNDMQRCAPTSLHPAVHALAHYGNLVLGYRHSLHAELKQFCTEKVESLKAVSTITQVHGAMPCMQ